VTSNAAFGLDAISGLWNGEHLIGPLTDRGRSVESIYAQVLVERLARSSFLFRPVFEESGASDGFVSIGIAPRYARDSEALVQAATELYQRVPEPNLMVEIPATSEGISAARRLVSEGRSVNVTLIVTLARYGQVIDAYLAGLESLSGNLSRCHCVASLAIGLVDAEVDRRLEAIGTASALSLVGTVALAQAKVAYRMFEERFFGARWQALVTRGAKVQRPLWSWTAVENPAYPKLWYVENLIGPNTVTALSESTIAALEDHGVLARSVDRGLDEAEATLHRLAQMGVDLEEVGRAVEHDALSSGSRSYARLLSTLAERLETSQPGTW
jgi:transaldolase